MFLYIIDVLHKHSFAAIQTKNQKKHMEVTMTLEEIAKLENITVDKLHLLHEYAADAPNMPQPMIATSYVLVDMIREVLATDQVTSKVEF